jgi:hypothetical protein
VATNLAGPPDVHAVLALLEREGLAPADQRELARAVAPDATRADAAATLATFTIALGALDRSSGSSASVSRTTASKFSSIVLRTFSRPASPNARASALRRC